MGAYDASVSSCAGLDDRLRACARAKESTGAAGWLLGCRTQAATTLIGCIATESRLKSLRGARLASDLGQAISLLPLGLDVVGALATGGHTAEQLAAALKGADLQEPFLLATVDAEESAAFSTLASPGSAVPVQQLKEAPLEWLSRKCACLRLQLQVTAEFAEPKGANAGSCLEAAVDRLRAQLCSDATAAVVRLPKSDDAVLLGAGTGEAGPSCGELGSSPRQPVEVNLLCASDRDPAAAPQLLYEPFKGGPCRMRRARLALDVLWYAPKDAPLASLSPALLAAALRRQLQAAQPLLATQAGDRLSVSALHFAPEGLGHHVTLQYPLWAADATAAEEAALEPERRRLHEQLLLPLDRPLLRLGNAAAFGGNLGGNLGGPLQNVHEGLKPSGVPGGRVHMVWGTYSYHHYMQDRVDDSGWGCAYRSLQTICSWIRHQAYTDAPVPSHREIQQCLVSIGDKERSFLGSRQWIGAIELGFVLETLLGVASRVITVPSGADMDTRAEELARHFDEQGTPVMIGGGVLAYTLLGIDWNPATRQCAYLILDPHYTGPDDLARIQGGHWVAWKRAGAKATAGGDLFVKSAFYNLLCPQRPRQL